MPLVNSQLVCLLSVGILNLSYVYLNIYLSLSVYIGSEKPQWGVANSYSFLWGKCVF